MCFTHTIIVMNDRPFDKTRRLYTFEHKVSDLPTELEEYVGTFDQFKAFLNRTWPSTVVLTLAEWLGNEEQWPMDEAQAYWEEVLDQMYSGV